MKQKSTIIQRKFGEKVKELRMTRKMSQEKLGFESGLDRTYISGIERGERNPSLKNIGRIAKALKIEIPALFS